ncbi:MAG: glutamine synthetase family protein [Gammaproteobacteria bacterium]
MERWLDEQRILDVECLVPDMTGIPRGRSVARAKLMDAPSLRLPEAVLGMTVTGAYPSDDSAYSRAISAAQRDMLLRPDPSTVTRVPWAADHTAQVLLDCHFADGQPVDFAPRSVLRRVLGLYAAKGWRAQVAPELEFYLTARSGDPNIPLRAPVGRSGRAETSRQIYSIDAVNEFDPLFECLYDYCERMEIDAVTLIHEIGAGQMGIDFLPGEPLAMADTVVLFKRAVREVALRHGMHATFMAKPMMDEPGSAMHLHQTVFDAGTGGNLFTLDDGAPSPVFHHYLGGLQRYMPAAMALGAPYVNSYRRIVRGSLAPINVQWGVDNRTVGFRIPPTAPHERHIENRVIGADANPYLALAATLACGYLGMVEKIEPGAATIGSAHALDFELPESLPQALRSLRADDRLCALLGERFVDVFCAIKEHEYMEFMTVISPWEREHLLLHV